MPLKDPVKSDLKLVCSNCGKPLADKARSNVTRWLFQESRCTCAKPNIALISASQSDVKPSEEVLSDEAKAEINKTIGDKYEVLSLIGTGGMGSVYKVKDKSLGKFFAIKILNANLIQNAESVRRFKQEAQAASRLDHANLVAVYDYGVGDDSQPFIVMDYVDGISLASIIAKDGAMDVPRALDIFVQIADAINYAHQEGVIHRDIKPGNIIIEHKDDGNDYVKIIDFGIAKVLYAESAATQELTQTGEVFGSPLYMSPEQGQGKTLDARTDIYAIGCVMYETLTGKPPFSGANPIQTILKHINDDPLPINVVRGNDDVPVSLSCLVFHCLEKDPQIVIKQLMLYCWIWSPLETASQLNSSLKKHCLRKEKNKRQNCLPCYQLALVSS